MSQTVAEAAAAYRKRRASKMARYEAALRDIVSTDNFGDWRDTDELRDIARNALNPETNDG